MYHGCMNNKRKSTVFAAIAAVVAASDAPIAANQSNPHLYVVLPMVAVAVLLFVSGYYAGLSRSE